MGVFDPAKIADTATYDKPHSYAVSLSRHMSDELTRHMSDFGFWVICLREEVPDAVKSDIDGGDTDGAF